MQYLPTPLLVEFQREPKVLAETSRQIALRRPRASCTYRNRALMHGRQFRRGSRASQPRLSAKQKARCVSGPLSKSANRKSWSGRRDSNPRPRPWQGRALPLSYTRIRATDGNRAPATGRAMPNAALECNSRAAVRPAGRAGPPRGAPRVGPGRPGKIGPNPARPGSTDCKLGLQAPIKGSGRARTASIRQDIRRGYRDDN